MLPIKKEITDIVNSRYEILTFIDLIEYDHQISELEPILSQYSNHTFNHNQRIIFLHNDTDYYISPNNTGFTMYNLFLLLDKFKIPLEFLIMFTTHHGIQQEIAELSAQICNAQPMKTICTELWRDFPDVDNMAPLDSDHSSITKLFCCLNGVNRSHRMLTLCYLQEYDLLDKGMISYHFN